MSVSETELYVLLLPYLAAGVFFFYKLLTGYLMTNLSVSISDSRQCASNGKDHLVVNVSLAKGERGSLNLHDAQVKVKWKDVEDYKPLVGTDRRSFTNEIVSTSERKVVNWSERCRRQPFLRLTAGESCHFAAYFEVPCTELCEIEVAVLGMKQSGFRVGQWRGSLISLPHQNNKREIV